MKFVKLLNLVIISIAIFLAVALLSYLVSKEGEYAFRLGSPFTFYEQFKLRGNDFANFAWTLSAAIYDYLIICSALITVHIFLSKKKTYS